MRRVTASTLFVLMGWLSLVLGFAGIFLPVLPTTPFVLLAAYCFSKGSTRLHAWLLSSKLFGGLITDWERDQVIRFRAKLWATLAIVPLFGYTLGYVEVNLAIKVIVAITGVAVLAFIWSRPSRPIPVAEPASGE